MRTRIVVVGIIKNKDNKYLLCKMAEDHGVYPGEWGLIGGGVDEGEDIKMALVREIKEEAGLKVLEMKPLFFGEDRKVKKLRQGGEEEQYLIYLLFEVITEGEVVLNDEWEEYQWLSATEIAELNLNNQTRANLQRYGLISASN
ncbi:MAG TPA: nucleoside triphosphatase NudI [Vitreimonas sp.]|nr:nucleoside triphosphatase NudI [Vitreimonas sp.]